uniref:Uncharacterized protein n=1 Tax=Octopus bimaculoides TaxID=37653 RepID=A0A0L8GFN1_OCTBM
MNVPVHAHWMLKVNSTRLLVRPAIVWSVLSQLMAINKEFLLRWPERRELSLEIFDALLCVFSAHITMYKLCKEPMYFR